jgi:hypothetical protein
VIHVVPHDLLTVLPYCVGITVVEVTKQGKRREMTTVTEQTVLSPCCPHTPPATAKTALTAAQGALNRSVTELQVTLDIKNDATWIDRNTVPSVAIVALMTLTLEVFYTSDHWAFRLIRILFTFVVCVTFTKNTIERRHELGIHLAEARGDHIRCQELLIAAQTALAEEQALWAQEQDRWVEEQARMVQEQVVLEAEQVALREQERLGNELVVTLASLLFISERARQAEESLREAERRRIEALGHVLYRFFNTSGDLLYIGITGNTTQRFRQHADHKPWWPEVADVRLEYLPSRAELVAVERLSIVREHPRYNIIHKQVVRS